MAGRLPGSHGIHAGLKHRGSKVVIDLVGQSQSPIYILYINIIFSIVGKYADNMCQIFKNMKPRIMVDQQLLSNVRIVSFIPALC